MEDTGELASDSILFDFFAMVELFAKKRNWFQELRGSDKTSNLSGNVHKKGVLSEPLNSQALLFLIAGYGNF